MRDYVSDAEGYFVGGYNCSQAVLLAFAEPIGLTKDQALKLASSFGGGMGRLREVCGALTAVFMIEGMLDGYTDPTASDEKAQHYARIQAIAGDFRQEMGSIICRDLLDKPTTTPTPDARTDAYYSKRPCNHAVRCGAKLAQELLKATSL